MSHLKYAPVLLACIEAGSSDAAATLAGLDDKDWRALPSFLELHGIAPLAFVTLRKHGWLDRLPATFCQTLAEAYERNAARSMVQLAEFDRIADACARHGLPVIPLKGCDLARSVYADPALRVIGDIDIQIRPQDAHAAADLLRGLGYRTAWTGDDAWKKRSCHLPPFYSSQGHTVEVHIDFKSPFTHFRTANEAIWARAIAESRRAVGSVALTATDLFLYLCIHLYRVRLRVGLRHLVDLRELIHKRGDRIDAETMIRHAHEWNMEKIVWTALAAVQDILNVRLPAELAPPVGSAPDAAIRQGIRHRIFQAKEVYSPSGLFLWGMNRITAPWRRYEVRLPPMDAREKEGRTLPLARKLRLVAGAAAGFLGDICLHPVEQYRDIRDTIREHRFDRWMMWP